MTSLNRLSEALSDGIGNLWLCFVCCEKLVCGLSSQIGQKASTVGGVKVKKLRKIPESCVRSFLPKVRAHNLSELELRSRTLLEGF